MHDNIETFAPGMFPYTTWNDIPNYDDVENNKICKSSDDIGKSFKQIFLSIPSYSIGIKSILFK